MVCLGPRALRRNCATHARGARDARGFVAAYARAAKGSVLEAVEVSEMSDLSSARLRLGHLRVTSVERTMLYIPSTPRVRQWNDILVAGWGLIELIRVHTNAEGVVGVGETLVDYTWARVDERSIARVVGSNPIQHLSDDSLGAGLQMALYDAVGKATGVPMSSLLSYPKVKDSVSIAWWNTKMPPEVLAEEAKEAVRAGYRAHKFKARPFFDVFDQVQTISDVTPDGYLIDLDWNGMLRTPAEAFAVLERLDAFDKIGLYESPIRQDDMIGHASLRGRVSKPLAEHYRADLIPMWMRDDSLDSFVVFGEGASGLQRQATVATAFNKTFWLQVVGTGLTSAFALHLSSVLTHATWPLVTAMNTLEDDLIVDAIEIVRGEATVPTMPGLGVDLDEDAVARYTVDDDFRVPLSRRILQVDLPGRGTRIYRDIAQLWEDCRVNRNIPVQAPGARLSVWQDDESAEFQETFARLARAPRWLGHEG